MNRVIKFRGKRVDNGEWIYGDLTQVQDGLTFSINPIESDTLFLDREFVHPESVGQFTGLTDKNGKEIYEGDIVKYDETTQPDDKGFICQFKDYRWKFNNVRYPDDDIYGTVNYLYIERICQVIGNLHDNPELLP